MKSLFLLYADLIGIVQNVSSTLSIRRKSNNDTIPKRDITIADDSYVMRVWFIFISTSCLIQPYLHLMSFQPILLQE